MKAFHFSVPVLIFVVALIYLPSSVFSEDLNKEVKKEINKEEAISSKDKVEPDTNSNSILKVSVLVESEAEKQNNQAIQKEITEYAKQQAAKLKKLEPALLKVDIKNNQKLAKVKMSFDTDDLNPQHKADFSSFHWSSTSSFGYTGKEQLVAKTKELIDDLFKSLNSSESNLDVMQHNGVEIEEYREIKNKKPSIIKKKPVNSDKAIWI